jgi:hypothetical protein
MIKLDNALLTELGLGRLPASHRKALLHVIYAELEMRVGRRLAWAMSASQLSRFEVFFKSNDRAGALAFLETEFPTYRDVVSAEFDDLRAEIGAHVPAIEALSWTYIDIPIELPPRKGPWDRQDSATELA